MQQSQEDRCSPQDQLSTGTQHYEQIYQEHIQTETEYIPQVHSYSISTNKILLDHKEENISIQGYLLKKSPNILRGWQKRFCVVKDCKLFYYQNEKDQTFKGCIDFNLTTVNIDEIVKAHQLQALIIKIVGAQRQFIFKEDQEKNLVWWKYVITRNIEYAKLKKKDLLYDERFLYQQKEFWRNDRISLSQFQREADTGDILLFKGTSSRCKVQRALTGQQYDHVAILLRYNSGQLFLFESTGSKGVDLYSWNKFVNNNCQQTQSKLAYRKLDLERSQESVELLESFIKLTIGKKYSVSASKLLNKWKKEVDDENSTYFCSELVAGAYKNMGLLSQDIASSQYWPGSFSSKNKLNLLKGQLLQERLIDFTIYERPVTQSTIEDSP